MNTETGYAERLADFHVRLGRLETQLEELSRTHRVENPLWVCMLFGLIALVLSFQGLRFPNHYSQPMFAVLITLLALHRRWIFWPKNWIEWVNPPLLALVLCLQLKIFLGGGAPKPLAWLKLPVLEGGLSSFTVTWHSTLFSELALPLSTLQGFIFVLALFAIAISFEIFAGLLSFLLVMLSVPALTGFDWKWVLPSIVFSGAYFYLLTGRKVVMPNPSGSDEDAYASNG